MRKALTAFIAASAVAFTVVCLPIATPTSAATCDDIKFIFARGSGQKLNDKDFIAFRTEINNELRSRNVTLKYSFYELGSSIHGNAQYPAVALNFFNIIGAKISAGTAFSYGRSVQQGITELETYISEINTSCRNTKFVLGGYSQGAQVITLTIPNLNPNKIIYSATFGDPKLYLPEGKGLVPDACLGKNLSPYREYAPNCHTSIGSLEAQVPYQPKNWSGKIGLWCKDEDLVCGAGVKLSDNKRDSSTNILETFISRALSSHETYADDGIFQLAAQTIAQKVQATYPQKVSTTNSSIKNRDTVVLIDKTYSMSPLIEDYKSDAMRLAKTTLENGGRIALYTYGDLSEEFPRRLVDFGATLNEFQSALDSITTNGGGDIPESLLSALFIAMNQQNWRASATKSIIALTDAGYHNPDYDGTTIRKVIDRSLSIDPVNIYIVAPSVEANESYLSIIQPTNGRYFPLSSHSSTDYLLSLPNVNFPLNEYSGKPNQEFTFTAITDDDIISYDWDLDLDGIFETTTTTPIATKTYSEPKFGYVQVRANTHSGSSSTASATVIVSNTFAQPAEVTNLHTAMHLSTISEEGDPFDFNNNFTDTSTATIVADVSFDFTGSAIAALISIDDTNLGITTENRFIVSDLTKPVTLTLTPISSDGTPGNPISTTLSPPGYSSAAEENIYKTDINSNPDLETTDYAITIPLAPNSGIH